MKTMRKLYDQCMEEIEGVKEYSKCSMHYKETDQELARMYLSMAKAEMEHAKALHSASQKRAAAKKDSEEIDPMLMELWQEMESEKLDCMAKAKAYLDLASS